MKILFIGIQGSGKSTQAQLLAKTINYPFYGISTLLRDSINNMDAYVIASYTQSDLDSGLLAPDHVIDYLVKQIKDENYVMEGYIRTPGQAKEFNKNNDGVVVELKISDQVAIDRMKARNRTDDNELVIKTRISKFKQHIAPIRDILNSYVTIDSNGTPEDVNLNIVTLLEGEYNEI